MAETQPSEGKREEPGPASASPLLWMGGGLPPRFRWVSPSLVQALGHAPEAWKARGFLQRLVHPEDLERVLDTWRTVARTGESRTLEFRATTAEARSVRLSVELNAVEPAEDGAGELVGTVRVLAPALRALPRAPDAPDLETVARELTRAQREHEELINAVDGIVWEADASFRFTFVSEQAERLLGYPVQQWKQEPDFWVKHLHPGDRDWAPDFCVQATRECRPHTFDYRMVAADGRTVWLRDIVSVVSEGGVPLKLRGIMVDITEQRRTQENLERTVSALRATLDSTADGVIVVDRDWKITSFNGRFQELWNVPRPLLDAGDGRAVSAYMLPQLANAEQVRERIHEVFAFPDQESFDVLERLDGRILERYSRPQRRGDTLIGRVFSYRDVTAQRRAQAERERLLREAEEAVRVRDDFLSIASHELKTPLTPLKLHLQALKQRCGSGQPVLLQHAEKALAQVVRLSGLINDLLDTSRIQAGRLELRHEPVALREFLREVLADLRAVSPHHTLEYVEPGEPLTLHGDRGRLAQVLVNLVENAVKYSPMGGTIRVTLERGDGARARVSVEDGGIGIPADQKEHLFERFFRARNAPISGFGGLGLGLYICRDIVERHGGHIWVESEVGHGSTFRFTLPVEDGPADAPAPPAPLPGH